MLRLERYENNPILKPKKENFFESGATFNPSVIKFDNKIIMLFRSSALVQKTYDGLISISSIGIAYSKDGINFTNEKLFFGPQFSYEAYGCEDPRVTKVDKEYFVTYTAVSSFPPKPENVRLALLKTKNFKNYEKFGLITPFNSKAGAIFPKKFEDKFCLIFTYHPDIAPSQLSVIFFEKVEDLKDDNFWKSINIEKTFLSLERESPFVELGSPPLETKEGWLVFVPDIVYKNGEFLEFRISAILLDKYNPQEVKGQLKYPLLVPEASYECEREHNPKKIAFPSGALILKEKVYVYYGASDKYCCLAYCNLNDLLSELVKK